LFSFEIHLFVAQVYRSLWRWFAQEIYVQNIDCDVECKVAMELVIGGFSFTKKVALESSLEKG